MRFLEGTRISLIAKYAQLYKQFLQIRVLNLSNQLPEKYQ